MVMMLAIARFAISAGTSASGTQSQRHERYLARQHLAEDYLALAIR